MLVLFAKVGTSPKRLNINSNSEVLDLFLDNPTAYLAINGQQIDLAAIERDKRLNRCLKLKILQRKSLL